MAEYTTAYIITPKSGTSLVERYGKFVVEMIEDARQDKAEQLRAVKQRFLSVAAGDEDDEIQDPEWLLKNFDTYWTVEEAEDIFHAAAQEAQTDEAE